MRKTFAVSGLALSTLFATLSLAPSAADAGGYRVTAPSGLNLRRSPGGPVRTAMPHGSIVCYLDRQGRWRQVEYSTRRRTYIGWAVKRWLSYRRRYC